MDVEKDLATSTQAARLMGVTKTAVIKLANKGILRAARVGTFRLVHRESIEDYRDAKATRLRERAANRLVQKI